MLLPDDGGSNTQLWQRMASLMGTGGNMVIGSMKENCRRTSLTRHQMGKELIEYKTNLIEARHSNHGQQRWRWHPRHHGKRPDSGSHRLHHAPRECLLDAIAALIKLSRISDII